MTTPMHDETLLTVERVTRVLTERVLPAVHGAAVPLTVTAARLPGEPIPVAEALALQYEPFPVGSSWGPAWSTVWFHLTGEVPAEFAGRRVEAVIDLGFDASMPGFQCEGLVHRADGSPVKSVNPRNQWVLVTESAVGGEQVDLFVEAAANPILMEYVPFQPTLQGDILTSSSRELYTVRRMDLAVLDEDLFELSLDLQVLLELQEQLPTGPRKMRILQALDDALDRLDLQQLAATAVDARAELVDVLTAPADASAHRISAVGHAHIDSAWLWPVRETIRKVARTTASMAELIEQTDEFVYGMSSAQQYAWIKEHRPEVYARVKEAVAGGRFLPLGGMWVESDTVMPTGEALVRQFSHGQRFFEQEFGFRSRGVWLPDSFGYSPALPQLMRRAGFEWFFTQKISWNQVNVFPHHTFAWEGIDGSRVLTHFPPMDTYNSRLSGEEVAKASQKFRENRRATGSIAPVGWGDGGGGATREMVGTQQRLADLEGSARVVWEHPDAFFERAAAELSAPPVWVGELYLELHRATLTSQHLTKQGNRRCEQLLIEAELWSATAAARTDFDYPYGVLDALWQQVLLQQFHDILPGTSIAWVHREAAAEYARVAAAAGVLIEDALSALVGSGSQALVANPAAFDRGGVPAGGVVVAAELPVPSPGSLSGDPAAAVLDNGIVRIVIDDRGLIVSAVDLASGRDVIPAGQSANLLQLHQDFPNKWDAWDVDRFYRNRVDDLTAVDRMTAAVDADGVARVTIVRSFSSSTLTQVLSLAPGTNVLEIAQSTDWHETEKFLKVAFPLDIRAEHTVAETQFGVVKRVTHTNTSWEAAKFETSQHRFVQVSEPVGDPDGDFGVALVNDSSYGFDVSRDALDGRVTTTVRLSLLRAPRFPDPETDQGVQTHRYGLVIGASVAEATRAGVLLNAGARTVSGAHGSDPLVRVGGGLVLSAVKLADDRSGDLIVRVYEPEGRRTSGTVEVDGPFGAPREVSLIEDELPDAPDVDLGAGLPVGAFEVRTFRYPRA